MGLGFGTDSGDDRRKNLKRMGKSELIDLAIRRETEVEDLQGQLDGLRAEMDRLRSEVEDRDAKLAEAENQTLDFEDAGSLAEASIRVSNVFADAQKAANIYLENIRKMEARTRSDCERRSQAAEALAKKLVADARDESDRMRKEAELASAKREREAEKYYESVKERTRSALTNLSRFHEDYENLKRIASAAVPSIEAESKTVPDEEESTASEQKPEEGTEVVIESGISPEALYRKMDSVYNDAREEG